MFNCTSDYISFVAFGSEIWHPKGMGEGGLTCRELILSLNVLKQGNRILSVAWQMYLNI